jgi:hypothetical protein
MHAGLAPIEKLFDGVRAAYMACQKQGVVEAARPPQRNAELKIVSGHAWFDARLDSTLQELGILIQQDDIYRKRDTAEIIRLIAKTAIDRFPWTVKMRSLSDRQIIEHRVGYDDEAVLDAELDIVIGPEGDGAYPVSGKAVNVKRKWRVSAASAMGQVLQLLADRHLTPRGRSPHGSSVSVDEINDALLRANQKGDPPSVIFGIKRNLYNERGVLPEGRQGVHQFSEDANIAIIQG